METASDFIKDLIGFLAVAVVCIIGVLLSKEGGAIKRLQETLARNKRLKEERAEIEKKAEEARQKVEEDLKNASDDQIIDQFHDAFGRGIPDSGNESDGSRRPD